MFRFAGIAALFCILSVSGEEAAPLLYPINAIGVSCRGPFNDEHVFIRSSIDPNYLQEAGGEWEGKIHGRKALIVSSSVQTPNEGTRYEYTAGLLTSVFKDGQRVNVKVSAIGGSFDKLYPPDARDALTEETYAQMDLWKKSGRLRLWWRNPNKTGAFLVTVLLLLVGLSLKLKGIGRILLSLASLGMFVPVLMTDSRGAFVAALMGLLVLLLPHVRWRTAGRWICLTFGVIALAIALALYFHVADHYTRGLFETRDGNSLRLDMLSAFPKMLADAPGGWGVGNSGASYVTWYRDPELTDTPRTLLNSHMTFLAEHGNVGRVFYCAFWLWVLSHAGWVAVRRKESLPLSEVVALGVASLFNPILEDALCCALPIVVWLISIFRCPRMKLKVCLWSAGFCAALALGVVWGITAFGRTRRALPAVSRVGKVVHLQGTQPKVWVAGDEFVLGGWDFIGNEFRIYYERNPDAPAIAYVEDVDDLPPSVERLVLAGRSAEKYVKRWKERGGEGVCRAKDVLFLSPAVKVTEIPSQLLLPLRARAVVGSLAARLVPGYAEGLPEWARLAPGVLLYVPNWIQLAIDF